MLKHLFIACTLVLGLAFANNSMAQCGPNEVFFINESECEKEVWIDYGEPCHVMGSTTPVLVGCCGASVCIPIPNPWVPIKYHVYDLVSGNMGTVYHPDCGQTEDIYTDCNGRCDLVQWNDPWFYMNIPYGD